jgi:hypothetical protein
MINVWPTNPRAKAPVTAPMVTPFRPPINDPISLHLPVPQRYSRQAKHNQNLRQKSSRLLPFSDTDAGREDGCRGGAKIPRLLASIDSRPTSAERSDWPVVLQGA